MFLADEFISKSTHVYNLHVGVFFKLFPSFMGVAATNPKIPALQDMDFVFGTTIPARMFLADELVSKPPYVYNLHVGIFFKFFPSFIGIAATNPKIPALQDMDFVFGTTISAKMFLADELVSKPPYVYNLHVGIFFKLFPSFIVVAATNPKNPCAAGYGFCVWCHHFSKDVFSR